MFDEHISDGLCVLRFDAPPLNTISLEMLGALRAALRRAAEDDAVRWIVITGGPAHFSAGVDLGLFQELRIAVEAARLSRVFQEAFQEVEDCPKPIAAALAGRVLGGALELALACHYRVAAPGSRFGMPEVTLGFNPGAGGTQRLPRLVGPSAALRMLLTGQPIDVAQAQSLGLVDAVCEADGLIPCARDVLRTAAGPRRTSQLVDKIDDAKRNEAAFREAEGRIARSRPEILAPRTIVEAVRAGVEDSCASGLRLEQEGFAACIQTPAARNKIDLFFATRQTGKIAELVGVEPREVERVGVVGMGTMGTGIAQALLFSGLSAVVLDQDVGALERAVARIRASLDRRVAEGKLAPSQGDAMLGRLVTTTRWEDLAGADLVIEAVLEDAGIKRDVLCRLEAVCGQQAILASNTSTISLDELAAAMRYPGRLVGLHFFNPAHRMPLLEVIRAQDTSPVTIATSLSLARTLKKTPVLVRNREGFLVSRLFVPYLKEAFWLWQEGASPATIDEAMVDFGFPMGPLALIDMAGLDILVLTDRVLHRAFPRHGPLPPVAARLVETGQLGQKTGAGVYRYEPGGYTPHASEAAESLVAEIRADEGNQPRAFRRDEITERLLLRMVNEAFYILEEGIAREPSDVDVAVVLGIGFPDFRGGVLRYAEELGHSHVLRQLEKLAARWGARFAPCELLRRKGA